MKQLKKNTNWIVFSIFAIVLAGIGFIALTTDLSLNKGVSENCQVVGVSWRALFRQKNLYRCRGYAEEINGFKIIELDSGGLSGDYKGSLSATVQEGLLEVRFADKSETVTPSSVSKFEFTFHQGMRLHPLLRVEGEAKGFTYTLEMSEAE